MKRATSTPPVDLAHLIDEEAPSGSKEKPREIPFAGLFNDPGEMVPAKRIDEALAEGWAGEIDRDRG